MLLNFETLEQKIDIFLISGVFLFFQSASEKVQGLMLH